MKKTKNLLLAIMIVAPILLGITLHYLTKYSIKQANFKGRILALSLVLFASSCKVNLLPIIRKNDILVNQFSDGKYNTFYRLNPMFKKWELVGKGDELNHADSFSRWCMLYDIHGRRLGIGIY